MKKIAYLMHVDLNWIKQRPHFLAEKLAYHYEVDVYYIHNLKTQKTADNPLDATVKSVKRIQKIPFSGRSVFLQKIEKILNHETLEKIYNTDYHYVWFPSPILLQFIDITRFRSSTVIYDCMDDVLEFPFSLRIKKQYELLERQLLKHADIALASSHRLREIVRERGFNKEIHLVNNAVDPGSLLSAESLPVPDKNKENLFNIMYFGTVSQWFDFELISRLLELHKDISFTIIGPSEVSLPKHPRINCIGPVRHQELKAFAAKTDAFIMPFKLNELVKSVDPVKVYEYIVFMKPIFVLRYAETLKFKDFVYLYDNLDEISAQIEEVKRCSGFKLDDKQVHKFIEENSWHNRAEEVYKILEKSS